MVSIAREEHGRGVPHALDRFEREIRARRYDEQLSCLPKFRTPVERCMRV
jgi:hypothetical protein